MDDGATITQLLRRGLDPNTAGEDGEPPLVSALREVRLEVVDALWKHPDLDVNKPNTTGETALMMACLRAQHDWVRKLLDRGAQVNRAGWAPIHYAATGGDPRIVDLLVARGADLKAPNPAGSSALHMAARFGSEDVVRHLVRLGADPRARNPAGQDAIGAARWAGRESLAEWLERATPGSPSREIAR